MKKLFVFLFLTILLAPTTRVFAVAQVEINTASPEQLEEIIGIGPALAQRIIDARPFTSIDDLLAVKGIGEKTLQKIKNQGIAYVANQETSHIVNQPQNLDAQKSEAPNPTPSIQNPTPVIQTYPGGIVINEILPAPEGADENNEWIEIYNSNFFDVNIEYWKIQDEQRSQITYTFPKNLNIPGGGYAMLTRPQTHITLNNDRDGLSLLSPDGKVVDSMTYENTVKNRSYNNTPSGWQWSSALTPGTSNIISAPPNTKEENVLPKSQKIDNNDKVNIATAALGEPLEKEKFFNTGMLFLIAIGITIVCAGVILKIKKDTKHSPAKRDVLGENS